MPVSLTEKCKMAPVSDSCSFVTETTTSPRSVNLMALPAKFSSTWRNLAGSPKNRSGTSGATRYANSTPFSWARIPRIRMDSPIKSLSSKGISSSSSRPASILEKSRISLITDKSEKEAALTTSRSSRWSGLNWVSSTSSVKPVMEFKGVRISWLILARNSLLERLAASAAIFSWVRASACFRSVTSRMMPLKPTD